MTRSTLLLRTAGTVLALGAIPALAAGPPPSRLTMPGFDTVEALSRAIALTDAAGARQVPFGGLSIRRTGGGEWTVATFYLMFREVADGDQRRRESYWVARRVTGSDAPHAHVPADVRWASSARCPELEAFVRTMTDLAGERLDIGVPGDGDPSEAASDPVRYGLWTTEGRFRGTGYAAALTVSAGGGSPVANWIDSNTAATIACWDSATPPDGVAVR